MESAPHPGPLPVDGADGEMGMGGLTMDSHGGRRGSEVAAGKITEGEYAAWLKANSKRA